MADELQKKLGVEADLLPSTGGVFEVEVDGKVVFSKTRLGRFPAPGEVVELIRKLKPGR